jgi:hypothetical protein
MAVGFRVEGYLDSRGRRVGCVCAGLLALIAATLASIAMLWVAARRKHISLPSWARRQSAGTTDALT